MAGRLAAEGADATGARYNDRTVLPMDRGNQMSRRLAWLACGSLAVPALLASCGQDVSVFNQTPTGTTPTGGGSSTSTTGSGGTTTTTTGVGAQAGDCPADWRDCDGNPATPCDTDTSSSLAHCGQCAHPCGAEHAAPVCSDGSCQLNCQAPYDDCDGLDANGCETDTSSSLESCGGCGQPCSSECVLGLCAGTCDQALTIDEDDALQVVKAIGLCVGVQSAAWVLADGAPPPVDVTAKANFNLGHGVLPDFGQTVHPQEGTRLLALSTGTARRPGDPGYQAPDQGFNKGYASGAPAGFPKASPACPGITPGSAFDATGIELTLTVPPLAHGFEFDFKYYSSEWPAWVCSQFSDQFLVMLAPPPPSAADGNVVFDPGANVIGAHSSFVAVCGCAPNPPCAVGGLSFPCSLGVGELAGTGFETHAGTPWLKTSVPATPSSTITLRFVPYDSGDGLFDSTVLIDNFRWIASAGQAPVTAVLPNPL